MHVHFNIIWEEHEMRESERGLLCRVGVGGLRLCVYMIVCACARERMCASVFASACVCKADWMRVSMLDACVWQENRSWDLKNTCLGFFWDQCFELTVLFGFGWVFQRAAQDKRQLSRAYGCYAFSILRFQPFIAINFERLQSVLFSH